MRINNTVLMAFKCCAIVLFALGMAGCNGNETASPKNEMPSIFPDYIDVTIPSNIAPLNFKMAQNCSSMKAIFEGENGYSFVVSGKSFLKIPEKKWTKLLAGNTDKTVSVTVSAKEDGKWFRYVPFKIMVSQYPIDESLVYRLIAPGYVTYGKMGLYVRNLTTYEQRPIIENTLLDNGCVNCHSFCQNTDDKKSFHIRGSKGGTVLCTKDKTELLNTKTDKTISNFVYPYWHPSGKYIAYSVNNTNQIFHESTPKLVEVLDLSSDVVVYDVENNKVLLPSLLMREESFETFPSFSPDGRTLYFCSAVRKDAIKEFKKIKYDLCSISFDPEKGTFGNKVDTLVHAADNGKSISFPRPSPDGRYLMYTMLDYGNFSIWHREADLFLMNLAEGTTDSLDVVNSPDVESYHSWSSNGRWFVFSSRRDNGLYTMPFIALFDDNGKAYKPFLLPQKDPNYYESLLLSFNVPELVKGTVNLDVREVEHLLNTNSIKHVEY